MSKGVNLVIMMGNLGRDPEVRYTQSGTAVANFSLAVTGREKKGDEWVDHTEWVNVVAFGKTAENAQKYLSKGSTVHIQGKLRTRKWQDKEGKDRYTTEVTCNEMTFVGGGKQKPSNDEGGFDPNDEIPF